MFIERALIISYGSIGRRHERLLRQLGLKTAVVTRQLVNVSSYPSIGSAIVDWHPDYVVVASPTSRHALDFAELRQAGFKGMILVEKPVVNSTAEILRDHENSSYVGYNLRFLPVIERLKKLIDGKQIHSVSIWNAQYLPEWRPGRDYRKTSSASREAGGGVLRDLSHDLDFVDYLFGEITSVFGLIGKHGALEIETEDTAQLIATSERCHSVAIYLSYLDRKARHEIRLTTSDDSIECNLLTGELYINNHREGFSNDRDDSFLRMHSAIIGNDFRSVCTLEDAMRTVRVICAAELSAREQRSVTL